jgi:hypothetical protein
MRQLAYLDFDILLEPVHGRSYRARVIDAPAGQTPAIDFTVPFSELELENLLLRISRSHTRVRRVDTSETAAIKSFGEQLFDALFRDDLRVNLLRSLSEAAAKGSGLRIRLRLSDTPELAGLPWEFLYDRSRNRFLSLSYHTPLVRYLELPDPPRPLPVNPPLHVLVMISSPADFVQLDVDQEWAKLSDALAPLASTHQITLERLQTATLAALRARLRRGDCHVLHFVGHGGFDKQSQDGVLVLEDQVGRGRLVSGQDLGMVLHDHDPLRLVVLNACEGARSDITDPFAGTAQSLIQQGIPAVIAMQFEITDAAAITFAHELYGAVADGYPLDGALAEARKAMYADGNQVEWATPVLYLSAPDGRIFDMPPAYNGEAPLYVEQPVGSGPGEAALPDASHERSDQPRQLVAQGGQGSVESRVSDYEDERSAEIVAALVRRARESGMLVWENEAHGSWSFPLVALHEHPIEATDSKYFTAIMAVERRLSLKPRMRLVYVVTQLPASPEALRLFVDAARSYATQGRFRESLTKNVTLLSVPVAVIPTSQITQPKSHIRTMYTEVFVLLDSRTLEVLFQIPRRFIFRTQAEEMIRSFLTVV